MNQLTITLLIKELVAARDVIRELNRSNKNNPNLEKAVQNYDKTCDEIKQITQDKILIPLTEQEKIRKLTTRFE